MANHCLSLHHPTQCLTNARVNIGESPSWQHQFGPGALSSSGRVQLSSVHGILHTGVCWFSRPLFIAIYCWLKLLAYPHIFNLPSSLPLVPLMTITPSFCFRRLVYFFFCMHKTKTEPHQHTSTLAYLRYFYFSGGGQRRGCIFVFSSFPLWHHLIAKADTTNQDETMHFHFPLYVLP